MPKEVVYGFALGVQSGAGLGSDPPQPGDKPSIIVVVDQSPPQLKLLPLEQGRGRAFNKILVQWRFRDDYPADKPIAISFSATGQGPWQSITGWTENTGSYVWTMVRGARPSSSCGVQRDQAGNLQAVENSAAGAGRPVAADRQDYRCGNGGRTARSAVRRSADNAAQHHHRPGPRVLERCGLLAFLRT